MGGTTAAIGGTLVYDRGRARGDPDDMSAAATKMLVTNDEVGAAFCNVVEAGKGIESSLLTETLEDVALPLRLSDVSVARIVSRRTDSREEAAAILLGIRLAGGWVGVVTGAAKSENVVTSDTVLHATDGDCSEHTKQVASATVDVSTLALLQTRVELVPEQMPRHSLSHGVHVEPRLSMAEDLQPLVEGALGVLLRDRTAEEYG